MGFSTHFQVACLVFQQHSFSLSPIQCLFLVDQVFYSFLQEALLATFESHLAQQGHLEFRLSLHLAARVPLNLH